MITKYYKDKSGIIWKGPLFLGDKDDAQSFFATYDLSEERRVLDPSWVEIEQAFAVTLEVLNKYIQHMQLSINAPLLRRSREVAVRAHIDQKRWNGDAYVTHPFRVSEAGETENEKIVGNLHDVVEDSDVTLDMLSKFGFTQEQVEAVDSVTRRDGESYLDFVLRSKKNNIGRQVKIYDLNDNLRDLGGDINHNRKEKYQMAVWMLGH